MKKQLKKNWPKKYDWEALRLEFLVSPIADISEWWRHKRGTIEAPQNGNFKKQTKWWLENKKQLREEVTKQAMEELKKEMVEAYKPSAKELSEVHQAIFTLIKAKIRLMQWGDIPWAKITNVDVRDLKALWEMVKIEKWEPTKYEKTDQILNHSFTSIEILDAEWEETSTKTDKKTKRAPKSLQW